ncbi:hypothetical protein LTR37_010199 [Vermiconidia calcicola]|uniref:Uncharacterized protein n=1 Tax=Vermiconidia calcicola TaxID=1690605 RepID=A0ACC3N5X7_9PEZI|nr:hypothetical protein LTR37_010199 [Vermiconidia calcicola]
MADNQNGSPLPQPATAPPSQGRNQRTPSAAQNASQTKRNKHRKNLSQTMPQFDGSVSDSVANLTTTPQSKKAPKHRQQSVAMGALPSDLGNVGKASDRKPRPVSLGADMHTSTPFKEQAYAGPTFQASPAPSSLPVPKFFSKSVPNVAAQRSLESRLAGESTPGIEHSSPEAEAASPPPPPRAAQQSPLDMFFKADRAEREKGRSGSVQSPEMAPRRAAPATEPRNPFLPSEKSIFMREMDGDEAMVSPKSLPHKGRPVSVHQPSTSPSVKAAATDGDSEREAYTKSLKDLLFNSTNAAPPQNSTSPNGPQRTHSSPRAPDSPFQTPPSLQRSNSGPSTPTHSTEPQNHYTLHYGNRNLSPLFKAARQDTPPRPSRLRKQELASDVAPTTDSPATSRQPPQIDPNSFSRNYLDQHIRASQPAALPPLAYTNGTASPSSNNMASGKPTQNGIRSNRTGSGASPRTGGASNDVRTMEDDLRRALVDAWVGWFVHSEALLEFFGLRQSRGGGLRAA